jgi:hypothetical protein
LGFERGCFIGHSFSMSAKSPMHSSRPKFCSESGVPCWITGHPGVPPGPKPHPPGSGVRRQDARRFLRRATCTAPLKAATSFFPLAASVLPGGCCFIYSLRGWRFPFTWPCRRLGADFRHSAPGSSPFGSGCLCSKLVKSWWTVTYLVPRQPAQGFRQRRSCNLIPARRVLKTGEFKQCPKQ